MKTTNTTPQHTPQKNYTDFLELFSIFEKSIEKNDIENINILSEKLFNILPFKDEKEKENYLNLLQSFKFWDDLKNKTFEIANRLKKETLKVKALISDLTPDLYDFYFNDYIENFDIIIYNYYIKDFKNYNHVLNH